MTFITQFWCWHCGAIFATLVPRATTRKLRHRIYTHLICADCGDPEWDLRGFMLETHIIAQLKKDNCFPLPRHMLISQFNRRLAHRKMQIDNGINI